MDIAQASVEFEIRYYLWAQTKVAEEIEASFPHYWLFKGGSARKGYQFIKQLGRREQEIFASGVLKRYHNHAAKALGETISAEEQSLFNRFLQFAPMPSDFQKEMIARKKKGEKIKFVSKRKLQKAMTAAFQKAFDRHGLEIVPFAGDPIPLFRIKCCGWIVQTNFDFGRTQSLIRYDHVIVSEQKFDHPTTPGVTAPVLMLANALGWIKFLNISWEYLMDEDVEPACDSVITQCREFFDELPKLLKGLERDNVTGNSWGI
jgi:hypothetical protein